MFETHPHSRPALYAQTAIKTSALCLSPMPEGTIIQVLASPNADCEMHLKSLFKGDVRPVSPGQWFLISDVPQSHVEREALFAALEPEATGVDQSHGRVRIRISGAMVEKVLAKGTAVDLSLVAFPKGCCATTLIGHIAAHLTRIDEETFELIVLRGFAESLWNDLAGMSREYC